MDMRSAQSERMECTNTYQEKKVSLCLVNVQDMERTVS